MEESNYWDQLTDQALDEYVIENLIASGGHATVFLARNVTLQTKVALKVLGMPGFSSAHIDLDSALNEARYQAKINHRAIVRIYQPGIANLEIDGERVRVLYIPMEYAELGNCRDHPPFVQTELTKHEISIIENLIDGLRMVHFTGLVHNDIKPANILRFEDYSMGAIHTVLRITDFGIANDPSMVGIKPGELVGLTPEYMSPERLNLQSTAKGDVYSMGATLYYLLTGLDPIAAPENVQDLFAWQQQHTTQPRPNAWMANPKCPPSLALLIMRMMAVEPEKRPELMDCLGVLRDINDLFDKKVFGFPLPQVLDKQLERDTFPIRYTPSFRKIYKPAVHELCLTRPYVISIKMAHPVFSQYKRLIKQFIRKFSDCFSMYETYGTYDIQAFLWSNSERIRDFQSELELEFAGSSVRMGPANRILHVHDKGQEYPEGANPVGTLAIQLGIHLPDLDTQAYICDSFPKDIPEHSVRAFTFVEAVQHPTTDFVRTAIVDRVRYKMIQLTEETLSTSESQKLVSSESTTLSFSEVRAATTRGRQTTESVEQPNASIRHRFPRITMVELSTELDPIVVLVNFVARQYKDVHAVATAIMDLGEYAVKTSTYLETGRIIIQSDKVLF